MWGGLHPQLGLRGFKAGKEPGGAGGGEGRRAPGGAGRAASLSSARLLTDASEEAAPSPRRAGSVTGTAGSLRGNVAAGPPGEGAGAGPAAAASARGRSVGRPRGGGGRSVLI